MNTTFKIFKNYFFLLVFGILLFASCAKESSSNCTTGYEKNALNIFSLGMDFSIIIEGQIDIAMSTAGQNTYPKIVPNPELALAYGHKFGVDFGPNGVLDQHGNLLKGTVLVFMTDANYSVGDTKLFKLKNVKINEVVLNGLKYKTMLSANVFDWCLRGLTASESFTFNQSGNLLQISDCFAKRIIAGLDTEDPADDVVALDGKNYVYTVDGEVLEISSIEPLIMDMNCRYFRDGIIRISNGEEYTDLSLKSDGCAYQVSVICPDGTITPSADLSTFHDYWN